MQSRLMSGVETATNIGIGLAVSFCSQLLIFPHYDIHLSFGTNVELVLYFTGISIIRSYALRRFFNSIKEKQHDQTEEIHN